MDRVASRFARVEPRRHAREFVTGLLAGLPRKNCWTLAEHAGHSTPDNLQHLLTRAKWDADAVRDDLRGFVVDHLGTDDVVLVVDETGDLKKGTHTVGVQRQYTGTAGRIENSQVAVYLAYATPRGHAAIDRELYLPRSWTENPERCQAAGIPEDIAFATKPQPADTAHLVLHARNSEPFTRSRVNTVRLASGNRVTDRRTPGRRSGQARREARYVARREEPVVDVMATGPRRSPGSRGRTASGPSSPRSPRRVVPNADGVSGSAERASKIVV